eukprot:5396607-Pleurochrysis_carterae.AAC.1
MLLGNVRGVPNPAPTRMLRCRLQLVRATQLCGRVAEGGRRWQAARDRHRGRRGMADDSPRRPVPCRCAGKKLVVRRNLASELVRVMIGEGVTAEPAEGA